MQLRPLGRTGMSVSAIGFGAWAIGGSWGAVDDRESMAALHAAIDAGVTFIDTADVYGDGRSERLVARLKKERPRHHPCRDEGRPTGSSADTRGIHAREPDRVDRQEPGDLDHRRHRPPAAPLSAPGGLRSRGRLRDPGRPEGRGQAAALRRERRDRRRGAESHSILERLDRPDHLQCVPPEARGGILRGSGEAADRHHRSGPAGERTPDRQAAPRIDVRRHGSSRVQS